MAREAALQLKESTMGSSRSGKAAPGKRIGQAVPQHFKIDRDGWRRVSIGGRA
jgi:hypothetical protein